MPSQEIIPLDSTLKEYFVSGFLILTERKNKVQNFLNITLQKFEKLYDYLPEA